MTLRDLDPFTLSRELAAAHANYVAFCHGLRESPGVLHPFGARPFPGKTHFDFVQDLNDSDPLRPALLRWTHFLIDARIHVPWENHDAELLRRKQHGVKEPQEGLFSLSEMTHLAIDGQEGAPALWWRQRARCETALSDHRKEVFRRREEVGERLGVKDLAAAFNPLGGDASVKDLARTVLSETRDAAESLTEAGWTAFVEAALARSASEGWPARLSPDTLRSLFGDSELFRGQNVRLGGLPMRKSPMSFVRAAAHLGQATRRSLANHELPWVIAHEPHDLPGKRFGELFGLWSTSAPFLRKRLRLSPAQVREAQRALLPARLCHLRLLAARTLAREAARSRELQEAWEIICHLLCREELPPGAALSRFDVKVDSPTHLVAHLSALHLERVLMEEHDEDWYENPRAQEELREIARLPAETTAPASDCEAALTAFSKSLRQ